MCRVHDLFICGVGIRAPAFSTTPMAIITEVFEPYDRAWEGSIVFINENWQWVSREDGLHCNALQHAATRCNKVQHTATHGKCVLLQSLLPSTPTTTKFVYVATAPRPCHDQTFCMAHSRLWSDSYVTSSYEHAKPRNAFIGCPFIVDCRPPTWNINVRM